MSSPRLVSVLTAEALGTFLFFFVGAGAVILNASGGGPALLGVALAHGLALAVLVSALGAVSGAHFNPAVTVAVLVSGRITPLLAAMYVVVQLVAGVAAALALRAVFPEGASSGPVALGTPAVHPAITVPAAIAIEAVLTVLLVIAVFGTAIDARGPKLGGLAIGLAVAADILMGGPLTGAAMNPARWFGPAVVSGSFDNWYVWWVGPLVGAVVAAAIYRFALEERARVDVTPATPEGVAVVPAPLEDPHEQG